MPIQLRNNTQGSNLPSAMSHGVGLPVSDGGYGAASRALGQVAGAAGNIGARLQQKKQATDKALAETKRLARNKEIGETTVALAGTTDAEERKVLESKISNLSDPTSKDFIPWVGEDEDPIDEAILKPYQNRVYEEYQNYYYKNEASKAAQKSVDAFNGLRTSKLHPLIEGVADGSVPAGEIAATALAELGGIAEQEIYAGAYELVKNNFSRLLLEDVKQLAKSIEARIDNTEDPTEIAVLLDQLDILAKEVDIQEGPEQSELVVRLIEGSSRKIKDVVDYPKVDRAIRSVLYNYSNLITTSTSALDPIAINAGLKTIDDNLEFANDGQARKMGDIKHALTELSRLQSPDNTEERTDLILKKVSGESIWTGEDDADPSVRDAFEKRFEGLARAYAEAKTEEERLFITTPALETAQRELFSTNDRPTAMAKWRALTETISGITSPDNDYAHEPLTIGELRRRDVELNASERKPFKVKFDTYDGDGDSGKITHNGKELKFRLFGVDTPEYSTDPELAEKATEYNKKLLEGNEVTMVPRGIGAKGRMLVDVVFKDGTSLSKHLVNNRKGLEGPNFGKKQKHVDYDNPFTDSEVAGMREALGHTKYNPRMQVPMIQQTADQVFAKNEDGSYVKSESEILAGFASFYADAAAGKYMPDTIADTYMESDDPELQTMAASMKFLHAAGGDLDKDAVQVLAFNEIPKGTTKTGLVGPAMSLLGSQKDGFLVYTNTSRTINAIRESGDVALANVLEGYTERAVNYLASTRPTDFKSPEDLALAADHMISKLFTTINFSAVSGMSDAVIPAQDLYAAGIDGSLLARLFDKGTVTEEQFAEVILEETQTVFSKTFGDKVDGMYVYPPTFEDDPRIPETVKKLYRTANDVFRKFIKTGEKGKLERLIDQGDIKFVFDAKDPETGEPMVAYKVRQQNKTWKLSDYTIPLSEIGYAFREPSKYIRKIREDKYLEAIKAMDPWLGLPLIQ